MLYYIIGQVKQDNNAFENDLWSSYVASRSWSGSEYQSVAISWTTDCLTISSPSLYVLTVLPTINCEIT